MNWAKWIKWALLGFVILAMVVAVGGFIALHTPAFHHHVLATIEQKTAQATGGRVEIQSYDFKLFGLTANVYGVVIHGTEVDATRPLLSVDRLTIKLKIMSVLHHQINLNELALQHPVVRLMVNKDGNNNLPNPEGPKQSSSSVNLFDLAVGRATIERGEIYYNDQPHSLDAELHDLHTQDFSKLSSTSAQGDVRLRGGLEYQARDGRSGLMAVALNGDLASAAMLVQSDGTKLAVNNLRGKYALNNGRLSAQDLAANLLGGEMMANLSVRQIDQPEEINLHADLKDISIHQLKNTSG